MSLTIRQALIDAAREKGACWLPTAGEPIEVALKDADWILRNMAYLLADEEIEACAETNPRAALAYASDRLTPELLDACAKTDPWAALRCAADHLTTERLDACAKMAPCAALMYAADRLTPERHAWCEARINAR